MSDCEICNRIHSEEDKKLGLTIKLRTRTGQYAITKISALVDLLPDTPGQLIIVPDRHIASFSELNRTESEDFFEFIAHAFDYVEKKDFKPIYHHLQHHGHNLNIRQRAVKMLHDSCIDKVPDNYEVEFLEHEVGDGERHWHAYLIPRDFNKA
jgi:diadenosine tetraphosphate (Ap4A) HIT family hydrolase